MAEMISWIAIMSLVAAFALAVVFAIKAYLNGTSPGEMFFKPKSDPRLSVIEYANVDGRRKLLLIRRDEVEHLIMTGGPVDVVIETGIGEQKIRQPERPVAEGGATVFTRSPRSIAQGGGGPDADLSPQGL